MTDESEQLGWVDRLRRSEIELQRRPEDAAKGPLMPETGWTLLIDELHQQLVVLDPSYEIRADQGEVRAAALLRGLRHPDPEVRRECEEVVAAAEARSATICEHCGEPGRMRNQRAWHLTLCDACDLVEDERRDQQRRRIYEGQQRLSERWPAQALVQVLRGRTVIAAFCDAEGKDDLRLLLIGGDGFDTLAGGSGSDILSGGENSDTVAYGDHAAGVVATLVGGTGGNTAEDGVALDTIAGDVDSLSGTSFGDTLTGNGRANSLLGGQGADTSTASAATTGSKVRAPRSSRARCPSSPTTSPDTLNGGPGADTLTGGKGGDTFNGGDGTDTASYSDHGSPTQVPGQPVTVTVGDGTGNDGNDQDGVGGSRDTVGGDVENVTGTQNDDALTGSPAANRLDGGAGADTLTGLAGNDTLLSGNDQVADILDGGADNDTYRAEGFRQPQRAPARRR